MIQNEVTNRSRPDVAPSSPLQEAPITKRTEIGRREFVRSVLMMSALAAASSTRDDVSQFLERMQSEVDRIFNYVDSKVNALSKAVMNFGKAVSETIGKVFNSETSKKLFAWGGLAAGAFALGVITMGVARRITSPKVRTTIAVGSLLIAGYSYFFAHTSLALPAFMTIIGMGTLAVSKGSGGSKGG
jgi:hypothetical protein